MPVPQIVIIRRMRENPAHDFVQRMLAALRQRLEARPVSRSAAPKVQHWYTQLWTRFSKEHPGPWHIAEGCTVAGLAAWLDHGHVYLRWLTAPETWHRLPHSPGEAREVCPLGIWGKWELSAAFDGHNSPRLSAEKDGERFDWLLYYHRTTDVEKPLREAMRRAQLVNFLAGTQWAKPDKVGSLGVPYRLE